MYYIHQRQSWPELTWKDQKISPLLAKVRHNQGRLLGRMEGLGFNIREQATLINLTHEIITSSAIEGEILNPIEVRSSIARKLGMKLSGMPEASRRVEGIVELTIDATRNYSERLTKERLFGWHASLFPLGRSGMRKIRAGKFRNQGSDPMQVVSGSEGREIIHFEAPSGKMVNREVTNFLKWFERTDEVDLVLKAGIAHFWFVTIHPFEDGNGRISRAIADMALARSEATSERFYSMSKQIEKEKNDYYLCLEQSQRGGLDITSWLEWFLECLNRAIGNAEQDIAGVLKKSRLWDSINQNGQVNDRQKKVINKLMDGFEGKLTTAKYALLTNCSPDSALRDLSDLLNRGVLVLGEGRGRSTHYRLKDSESGI